VAAAFIVATGIDALDSRIGDRVSGENNVGDRLEGTFVAVFDIDGRGTLVTEIVCSLLQVASRKMNNTIITLFDFILYLPQITTYSSDSSATTH
jgi:hypothetical protein